jgi:RimJ/RimL family protein N-acetyltransferase
MSAMQLELAKDEDFQWLLGQRSPTRPVAVAPDLAPGEVIAIVRQLPANWLMIVGDELVGIIGLKSDGGDEVEVGYGVARSRWGNGLASAALGSLLPILADRGVKLVHAETSVDNPASQRVLQRNGFRHAGERVDEEDGPLIVWRREIGDSADC